MQVNRMNFEAIRLLSQDRAAEAEGVLQQALALDPHNTFTLNNMGYVAELNGDRESADFYYAKAKQADNHERHVTLASRPEDEGKKLVEVADRNDAKAEASIRAEQELNRRRGKGPVLKERNSRRPVIATPQNQQNNDDTQRQNNSQNPR